MVEQNKPGQKNKCPCQHTVKYEVGPTQSTILEKNLVYD